MWGPCLSSWSVVAPSCAMKHWRVDATSSCMLRIRLFCSHKGFGGLERHGARDVFVRGRVCCCLRQPERGAIAGDSDENRCGSVWIFSGLRVKRGLGRMLKPHPQKADRHGKQNQPEDPHGL